LGPETLCTRPYCTFDSEFSPKTSQRRPKREKSANFQVEKELLTKRVPRSEGNGEGTVIKPPEKLERQGDLLENRLAEASWVHRSEMQTFRGAKLHQDEMGPPQPRYSHDPYGEEV